MDEVEEPAFLKQPPEAVEAATVLDSRMVNPA